MEIQQRSLVCSSCRHLVGLFNRTIQFLLHGIRPIWVFDGKPPEKKKGELRRRHDLKQKAEEQKEKAVEEGKYAEAKMMAGRTVRVTPEMTEDAKKLIKLMGLPIVEAASEAEAQCAALVKEGKAYATATEDMDALTFGSTRLIRGFNSKKEPMCEISLEVILKEFDMTMDQFIDLCILCGCDYTPRIDGIAPTKAFKLIQECGDAEKVLSKISNEVSKATKSKRYSIPSEFDYTSARKLFKEPEVIAAEHIKINWGTPEKEELEKFLIEEKGFNKERVKAGLDKIAKSQGQGAQSRLDNFFKGGKVISSKRTATKGKSLRITPKRASKKRPN